MSSKLREQALERGSRRSSLAFYRVFRGFLRTVARRYLRIRTENTEVLDLPGPTVLAPVHRSHLDSVLVAAQSSRRIRALGKESLFTTPGLSYVCAALGAIPVRRGSADKDAMQAAKKLLDAGESMIVFPEGGRRDGARVWPLFDGAAWLAARTGARVIPIGVAGTEEALPEGARRVRRSTVAIVAGEPLPPPEPANGKRATREELSAFTDELALALQRAQDRAVEVAGS